MKKLEGFENCVEVEVESPCSKIEYTGKTMKQSKVSKESHVLLS
jgi:hypothetical protein